MPDALREALVRIYGESPSLAEQLMRYERSLGAFARRYGSGEVWIFRSPGRVNLIGEHTDYNHGYVLPMALDKDVLLLARPRADQLVRLCNIETEFPQRQFWISGDIPRQPIGDWANYLQGPAQLLAREHGAVLHGYDGLVAGAAPFGVPRGAGLASSSALTVAASLPLVVMNGLPLEGTDLADACGRAEWYVGTRGGIMDQFIAVLGQQGHALFLDCRPHHEDGSYSFSHVPMPTEYAAIVVACGVRHNNTGPLFNRRVAEGRIGVRLLQQRYPEITHLRDVDQVPWPELEHLLPEVIDHDGLIERGIDPQTILDSDVGPQTDRFYVRARCRHVISENDRVLLSVAALRSGDVACFGQLLRAAHASARDDYEISIPEIEVLVRLAESSAGAAGARLTGAGWGGCIVAMVESDGVANFERAMIEDYGAETGLEAQVFACRSAAGAGCIITTTV